jgi:hypothetical protein
MSPPGIGGAPFFFIFGSFGNDCFGRQQKAGDRRRIDSLS